MRVIDYVFIGFFILMSIFLYKTSKATSYIADYLYRGGTMYENQVIMIDKMFEMDNTLDDMEYQLEYIYGAM